MRKMTIKKLVTMAAVFMAVAVMTQAFVNLRQTNKVETLVDNMLQQYIPIAQKANEVQMHIVQVQQWLTDVSATRGKDGLDDGFDEAERHAKMFHDSIKELKVLNPQRSNDYDSLEVAFNNYYEQGKHMAQAYVIVGPVGGNPLMNDFDQVAKILYDRLQPLVAAVAKESQEAQLELSANAKAARWYATLFSVAFLVLLVAVVWGSYQWLLRPLDRAVSMTRDLAEGEGDLTRRLNENIIGELGDLARLTNTFVSKVQHDVRSVEHGVERLAAAATQLKHSTDSTLKIMEHQQAETDQVATAVDEMTATVHEVARNAVAAAESAGEADREAVNGRKVVHETIEAITMLAQEVKTAASAIQNVETHSDNIGQVSDVIRDIADQTNLLALNAAIEAARAGEQGRGFAVVADEVRSLAQRTQDSTAQIQTIIEQLQGSTREAVQVMERGRSKTEASVEQASRAGTALEVITAEVTNINDMNTQIASAAEEQGAVSEEINRSVTKIRDVSEQTVSEMSDVTQAGDELMGVVNELKGLVAKFKT